MSNNTRKEKKAKRRQKRKTDGTIKHQHPLPRRSRQERSDDSGELLMLAMMACLMAKTKKEE
jgi:hypothetical protein